MTEQLYGVTWYPLLLEGLFRTIPRADCKLLVCWNLPGDPVKRLFSHFNTPEYLYAYIQAIPPNQRHFFEIIRGEYPQKPRFDLDFSLSTDPTAAELTQFHIFAQQVRDEVVTALIKVGVDPRMIRVYSSNSPTAPKKISYHLILPQYLCKNATEAKTLWYYVNSTLPPEYKIYLDEMVYSSLQQFRLYGSSKTGTDRIKKLEKTWWYGPRDTGVEINTMCPYTEFAQFTESLISYRDPTADEDPLPLPVLPTPPVREVIKTNTGPGASPDVIEGALFLLNHCDVLPDHTKLDRVIDNRLILLRRTRPTLCPICAPWPEPHTGNHPYLILRSTKPGTWEVLYYCRSAHANKRSLRLGYINDSSGDIVESLEGEMVALDETEVVDPLAKVTPTVDYNKFERKLKMRQLMGL